MKIKNLIEKLKTSKGLPVLIIGIIAGLLLFLVPAESKSSDASTENTDFSREYVEYLETKAEKLICEIKGVSSCKVMVSVEGGYTYLYATNVRVTQNGDSKDTQKEYVTVDGNAKPLLTQQKTPEVIGVAVVCNGISAETEVKILDLLSALFDLPSNRISITK